MNDAVAAAPAADVPMKDVQDHVVHAYLGVFAP